MKSIASKKQFIPLFFIFYFSLLILHAQNVAINNTGATANPAAMLDVSSTTSGFLPPRMTTAQMNAITSPAEGLMVYNTTTKCFMFYTNGSWQIISCACATAPTTPGTITGNADPCYGSSGVIYSISAIVGAGSYTWTVPAGDTITAGQGTPVISVNIPDINYLRNNNPSGTISVTASNACGTSTAQSEGTYIDTSGASTFSPLSGIATIGITFNPSNPGELSYSWAFQNGNPATSASQNPLVTWSAAGTYTVSLTVSSYSGCTSTTTQSVIISPILNGQVFNYTGSMQTYTVPTGVTSVTIQAFGAQGGNNGTPSGLGGYAEGTLSVSPSQVLYVFVGGQGTIPTGGFNGGGNGAPSSPGGGGASDVRAGGTAYSNVVITAGGGGGQNLWGPYNGGCGGCGATGTSGGNHYAGGGGGNGYEGDGAYGGLTGGAGASGCHAGGGGGGGFTSGGGGTCATCFSDCGSAGTQGAGGNASYSNCTNGSGGGGGGYYGGGGAGAGNCGGGAGGGGCSATIGLTNVSLIGSIKSGNGEVIIAH